MILELFCMIWYHSFMSRPLRIEFKGALYHVTSRGDRKEKIFENDKDREVFLKTLSLVVERYNWLIHAYCLMGNHYHLMVETPDGNLSVGMRQLNGVYTQKYNKMHNMAGHLFQGRFKSILVEKESYLLELSRYIVLNPVRAKMVNEPEQWKWSSYGATVGINEAPNFLTTNWILSRFDDEVGKAQRAYKEFVLRGMEGKKTPWKKLRGKTILGKDTFIQKMSSYIKEKRTMKEIPRIERFASRPKLSELFNKTMDKNERKEKVYTAHVKYGYTMKEISQELHIHYSTVSKIIKSVESKKGK